MRARVPCRPGSRRQAAGSQGGNPYRTRNAFLLKEEKQRISYDQNGYTLPAQAQALLNLSVDTVIRRAEDRGQGAVRTGLRSIKARLLAGTFPT